jgi:hypothetical protein
VLLSRASARPLSRAARRRSPVLVALLSLRARGFRRRPF